jgi:hypothetical protein
MSEEKDKVHPAADTFLAATPGGSLIEWPFDVLIRLEGDRRHALRGRRFRIRRADDKEVTP